ncbi:hypothetical protein GCM10011316_14460 [Roseibium aquae]|uniref:Amine oxidase domain-containing protein n=1 Tax=Roseibium aquae TaxID=1323746 RepID=A0A916TFX0_9HYPH|nr:FAD-dependent oxidoreductase [Roseibium aquae]GGB43560.1 hypothetical protein GCM10011316_14460 [Roseibium aquae]
MTLDTDVLIVGAGLSGLALAAALRAGGRELAVLEARGRAGGRVLSAGGYDLGPAWIWPHQHRILRLARDLGLRTFEQHSAGRLIFENAQGAVRRDLDMAPMAGALRVAGGLARITDALAEGLGGALHLSEAVTGVRETGAGVIVTTAQRSWTARQAVLALPPRLMRPMGLQVADTPTWMAGHAKLIAVYDRPFWRDDGLNGDAISHRGPLAEIHDASPEDGRAGALFGFALPGAAAAEDFAERALAQLSRLFGARAGAPDAMHVKDWSTDPATATAADRVPPHAHPLYRPIAPTERLVFAGTEAAPTEGGFLEGALEAAEAAFRHLAANITPLEATTRT